LFCVVFTDIHPLTGLLSRDCRYGRAMARPACGDGGCDAPKPVTVSALHARNVDFAAIETHLSCGSYWNSRQPNASRRRWIGRRPQFGDQSQDLGEQHPAQEAAEIVGERVKLTPPGIGGERPARQPRPSDRTLAFIDRLLRHAALIVEGDNPLGRSAHVRHDEADAGIKLAWVPLDLGGPAPSGGGPCLTRGSA